MLINKKITLGTVDYFCEIECCYKEKKYGTALCIKNNEDDYYDGGDLNCLIENLEKYYDTNKVIKKYNIAGIFYLADVLYIYDYIPVLSGIKTVYSDKENHISSFDYISKNELDDLINKYGIKMRDASNFGLQENIYFDDPFGEM